jgi:hypothetical protein
MKSFKLLFIFLFMFSFHLRAQEIKTEKDAFLLLDKMMGNDFGASFYITETIKRPDDREENILYKCFGYTIENEYLIFGIRDIKYENGEVVYGKLKNKLFNLTDSIYLQKAKLKNSEKKIIFYISYKNTKFTYASFASIESGTYNYNKNYCEYNNKNISSFYASFYMLKSKFDPSEKSDFKLSKFKDEFLTAGSPKGINEEQRKYIVQANAANENKDYENAVLLYRKVLDINKFTYPDAYFNIALILANVEHYYQAVYSMKIYLILNPDGEDSRKAQDKIYEWELNIK